jgi:hypothetical protein
MSDYTFSWMSPKLEVRDTGKYGKGLFTRNNIRKNELLCVFGGYVMTRREEELLPETICSGILQKKINRLRKVYIDAASQRGE